MNKCLLVLKTLFTSFYPGFFFQKRHVCSILPQAVHITETTHWILTSMILPVCEHLFPSTSENSAAWLAQMLKLNKKWNIEYSVYIPERISSKKQTYIPPFFLNTFSKCEKSTFDVRSEHPDSVSGLVSWWFLKA